MHGGAASHADQGLGARHELVHDLCTMQAGCASLHGTAQCTFVHMECMHSETVGHADQRTQRALPRSAWGACPLGGSVWAVDSLVCNLTHALPPCSKHTTSSSAFVMVSLKVCVIECAATTAAVLTLS